MRIAHALLAAAPLPPLAAGALEPRFDHRDLHGPVVELLGAHDTVTVGAKANGSWRPALRAGWGVDVAGEGSELVLAAEASLRSWDDPGREHVLLAASARYRLYFGTEELKTLLRGRTVRADQSRLAAGPLVGLGVSYDFSQRPGCSPAGSSRAPSATDGSSRSRCSRALSSVSSYPESSAPIRGTPHPEPSPLSRGGDLRRLAILLISLR